MDQEQLQELRELVEFLKANSVNEFDMERGDLKVRIKFATGTATAAPVSPEELARLLAAQAPAAAPAALGEVSASAGLPPVPPTPAEILHEVKSPIVGTFYESASPGSDPFVKIGDTVEVGQVVCIVEAMKLMNEIEADIAGEIVQRIAITGQPVEYGQPLFAIRPR